MMVVKNARMKRRFVRLEKAPVMSFSALIISVIAVIVLLGRMSF